MTFSQSLSDGVSRRRGTVEIASYRLHRIDIRRPRSEIYYCDLLLPVQKLLPLHVILNTATLYMSYFPGNDILRGILCLRI